MNLLLTLRRGAGALVLSGIMALSAVPAMAQQEISPDHLALARQYVEMSDQANVYENRIIAVGMATMRTLIQQDPSISDPVAQAVQQVANEFVEDKSDLFDQFARIYATRFTVEELQQIVDFYSTETGQKLLEQNQEINNDLQTVLEVWERNVRTDFLARVRAVLREDGYNV